MMRSNHLAGFAMLIALGAAPLCGAATASVSGVVRDSSGAPQIGAKVQLLREDMSVVTSVFTDDEGRFLIASLLPGRYALKAIAPSFLPALREDVKVHGGTVVNLTLNTLYEVIQWLPADPRAANSQKDDWAWTLRSAANRPLLRWLEDGPLVVVSDGSASAPKLMARLMATGEAGSFGETGERFTATVEDTPASSRELLARVDFAPGSDGEMESMLGFRQDLGFAGSVQSVATVSVQPELESGGNEGLDEVAFNSSETMHFGEALDAEAGATAVVARLDGPTASTASAMMPYASIAWHDGNSTVQYRYATVVPNRAYDESQPGGWQPMLSVRDGKIAIEHGVHQEIGWERNTNASGMAVRVFADNISNPVIEAMSHFAPNDSAAIPSAVLFDSASGLLRSAGPSFSTLGVQASFERRIHGDSRVSLSYANGNALVMHALPEPVELTQLIAAARPRRAQTYSISLSGTLDGSGTRWHASYTWQPDDTITQIAPYALDAASPFLNIKLRQPIHITRDGTGGLEALVDMRNLLAEGYRPCILSDGSLLIFAQDQRSMSAGLAFTF
jgi:hypothetical protein